MRRAGPTWGGSVTMLPIEIEYKSLRVQLFSEQHSEDSRMTDLDNIEELREAALILSARQQQAMRRHHEKRILVRQFEVGDFVLQKIQTTKDRHQLSALWEGSYYVIEVTQPGSYRLGREDGSEVLNSWNIDQLRKFYV